MALRRVLQGAPTTARVIELASTDACTNLAAEEWVFRNASVGAPLLLLYRNAPCVVLGRNQNPWRQCSMAAMRAGGVQLARRHSGGGAVYHDLGNTNYSVVSDRADHDRAANAELLVAALSGLGIDCAASGRHDLLRADGRKFSGAAFRMSGDRAYHHGTLLLESDLEQLLGLLHHAEARIEGGDTASVRSVAGVSNLQLAHADVRDALGKALSERLGLPVEHVLLDPTSREFRECCEAEAPVRGQQLDGEGSSFEREERRMRSWDWVFGKTPKFAARSACGLLFSVVKGRIEGVNAVDADEEGGSEWTEEDAEALEWVTLGRRFELQSFRRAATGLRKEGMEESALRVDKLQLDSSMGV